MRDGGKLHLCAATENSKWNSNVPSQLLRHVNSDVHQKPHVAHTQPKENT